MRSRFLHAGKAKNFISVRSASAFANTTVSFQDVIQGEQSYPHHGHLEIPDAVVAFRSQK
jgi:hypothetical protein